MFGLIEYSNTSSMNKVLGRLLLLCLIFLLPFQLCAQSIQGEVFDQKGNPLSFISISVLDTNVNTFTNQKGYFELKLKPGTHTIIAHAIDYQSSKLKVLLEADKEAKIQFVLHAQTYQLNELSVSAKQKNPAVYIMRKAIAMAPYYRRQVLAYKAKVYLKGNGAFEKIPGLFKKMMLSTSNIEEGKPMLRESVNELQFFQPNTYKEKVISLKSNMKMESAPEPMKMLRGSFYNTSNQELISPLSPQAFSVYDFVYEGSFFDAGVEVNKIKVIPRRTGSDVYEGSLYIIDQLWCIHSLNLSNNDNLFEVQSKAKFAPLPSHPFVWLPVSYDFEFKGAMLGFKAKFHYVASLSNYQIQLNPNLKHIGQEEQTLVTKEKVKAKSDPNELLKSMAKQSNPSHFEMLKMMAKMRKAAESAKKESLQIDSTELTIDSTALYKDSLFWRANRTLSLDVEEELAYKISDTIPYKIDSAQSTQSENSGLNIGLLLDGKYSPKNPTQLHVNWPSPFKGLYLNTVDGWGLKLLSKIQKPIQANQLWEFTLQSSLPFERKALNGSLSFDYLNKAKPQMLFGFELGSIAKDFNPNGANALANAFQLLFYHSNNTRLYQEDFLKVHAKYPITSAFVLNSELKIGNRNSLENCLRYEKLEPNHIGITPNNETRDGPLFRSLDFSTYQLCNLMLGFEWNYGQYVLKRKDKYQLISSAYPTLKLEVTKSLPGIWGSDLNYTKVNVQLKQNINIWHWLELNYVLEAGKFLQARTLNFPDYFSFDGNTAWFMNDVSSNRFFNLPFYMYSTNKQFVMGKLNLKFKRIALKRLPYLNNASFKESIKINFLGTPEYHKYTELAYGLTDVLRVFDCYVFTYYFNKEYQDWGFRINLKLPLTF